MNLFLIFGICSAWFLLSVWKPELRSRRISLAVLMIALILLVLDFKVGSDTGTYIDLYYAIHDNHIDFRNPGFVYLIKIVQLLSDRYWVSVLACNLVVLALSFHAVIRRSKNYLMSLFLFMMSGLFIMYYSSGIRQLLAMAVFLFAYYEYLPERKLLHYYICCILSLAFHESGIVAFVIPLLFLYQKAFRKNPRNMLLLTGLGIVAVFALISFTVVWVSRYYWWVSLIAHFLQYMENTSISIMGLGMECVWFGVILLLYYLMDKNDRTAWNEFELLTWGFAFAVYLCMVKFPQVSRLCDYIQIIMLVSVPNWLEKIPSLRKKLIGLLPLLGLNFILMFGDMRFAVSKIQNNYPEMEVSMTHMPYIFVFDEQAIQKYFGSYFPD